MKKYLFVIFICFLTIITSCTQKESEVKIEEESEVKIKAGVIMKSGDIKIVARQEFMITKADLISLWEISKIEHLKDLELIEEKIKAEMDYDKKLNILESDIIEYQKSISKETRSNNSHIHKIVDELIIHLRSSVSIEGKDYYYKEIYDNLKKDKKDLESVKWAVELLEHIYGTIIKTQSDRGSKYINAYKHQLEELKEINKLIDDLETKISKPHAKIIEITGEMNKLKKELELRTNKQFEFLKNRAINDFQKKLKENVVRAFQTNLNGESSLTIKKGQYFLFGIAQVAQSKIIWNLPIAIEESEHYIELSNDNAISIDDEALVAEILEAFKRLE